MFEDIEDELARTADEARAPSPPPKDGVLSKSAPLKTPKSSRSKRVMKLACWADDARDPELIGETLVDLTTVLTKGEQDGALLACASSRTNPGFKNGIPSHTKKSLLAKCILR